ncbi:MAG: hypothetical protein QXU20_04295, partial [Candidatus Woesearchaeota archaeon]
NFVFKLGLSYLLAIIFGLKALGVWIGFSMTSFFSFLFAYLLYTIYKKRLLELFSKKIKFEKTIFGIEKIEE